MKHTSVENSRKTDVLDSLLKGALPKGFDENGNFDLVYIFPFANFYF